MRISAGMVGILLKFDAPPDESTVSRRTDAEAARVHERQELLDVNKEVNGNP